MNLPAGRVEENALEGALHARESYEAKTNLGLAISLVLRGVPGKGPKRRETEIGEDNLPPAP